MKDTFCIAAVDPGKSGAIAFYFTSHKEVVSVEDMPIVDHLINGVELASRFKQMQPDACVIELVSSRPGQGVASMFNFGVSFGVVKGVVQALNIPVHYVTPTKWKKYFSLSSDKEESRRRAIDLWPESADRFSRKRDDGRAEAALMAKWGAETVFKMV
jgi:crossover junction endodeoxyribonuclease RuvC